MIAGSYAAAVIPAFAGTVAALYLAPYAIKSWQRRQLRELCRRQRALVLTYDDGPSPEITPALLDLLALHDTRATFFVLGRHAIAHSQIVDRIAGEGHEIGCHSARHCHAWKTLPWNLTRDMVDGYRMLKRWVGQDSPYRPPHGKPYLPVLLRLASRGARPGWWTIDSGDTFADRRPIDGVLAAVRSTQGAVVLMHDRSKDADRHRAHVLELTNQLIRLAHSEGLALKRLSELWSAEPTFPGGSA